MGTEVPSLFEVDGLGPRPSTTAAGRVTYLSFFINGKPQPKGRPRSAIVKGHVQVFTDDNTLNWEQNVGWQVKQQLLQLVGTQEIKAIPFTGRVLATLRFNFDRPKSTPKSVQFPVKSRTDVDNLAKAILDALQNVGVLANDNIVTDLTAYKRFVEPGHPLGVEIELTAWSE